MINIREIEVLRSKLNNFWKYSSKIAFKMPFWLKSTALGYRPCLSNRKVYFKSVLQRAIDKEATVEAY